MAWLGILVVVTTVMALRLPQLERLARARTAPLSGDPGDAALDGASVRGGVLAAIVVLVVVTIAVAVVVSLLERWLGPAAWAPRSWLRLGAGGLVLGVTTVGLQLGAIALDVESVGTSPLALGPIAALAALVPFAFREPRSPRGYRRALVVTVAAGVLPWMQ
ncbi:hypothetical protein GCM10009846_05080 [Agrococcus versicolor]|uniref:Uncharacterized protein n=1 Tax=Agrococcus versicolor TaxID=501482 RepID=A0ABN3ALL4_9MICO